MSRQIQEFTDLCTPESIVWTAALWGKSEEFARLFGQIACARPTDELVEDRLRVRRNISSTDERAVRMSPRKAYFS